MSRPNLTWSTLSLALVLGACSPEEIQPEPMAEPEPDRVWPGQCAEGVEAGAPTELAWSVVFSWSGMPFYQALPDGALVTVAIMSEGVQAESWIDVRVFEPDGSERWSDRYYGYEGFDAWPRGVAVDADGNIYVSGIDIYGEILDMLSGPELLYDELLISWSSEGERRYRSRTVPCAIDGDGIGVAADGRIHVARVAEDRSRVCIQTHSPAGEPEPDVTVDVPYHEGLFYFGEQYFAAQWDGSFLIGSGTEEPGSMLARHAPDGEQLLELVESGMQTASYRHFLLPGLVGDGRTVVTHQVQYQGHNDEVWMIDREGKIVWRADGHAHGVNCASDVIAQRVTGSFTLHAADDGRVLHEWSNPLPGDILAHSEFIASPDGAVYVAYRIDNGDYVVARFEPPA